MEFDLAQTRVKLEEALERIKFVHQAITVDLPCVAEVGFLRSSLTPWSSTGYLSVFASCFVGLGGDVELQALLPPGGACSDGVGGHGISVGH